MGGLGLGGGGLSGVAPIVAAPAVVSGKRQSAEATLDASASITATYTRQRLESAILAGDSSLDAAATVYVAPAAPRLSGGMVGFPRNPPHKWWQKRPPKPKKEEEDEEELAPAFKAAEDDTVELMAVVMAMEDDY